MLLLWCLSYCYPLMVSSKNVVFYPINARREGFERINFDFLQKKFEKVGAGGKMLRKMGVQPLKG